MSNGVTIEGEALPATQMNLGTILSIPAVRQVLLLIGVAASVALGFAVVLWSQSPDYTRLYADLPDEDAAQVIEALRAADIDVKLDAASGSVLVLGLSAARCAIGAGVSGAAEKQCGGHGNASGTVDVRAKPVS